MPDMHDDAAQVIACIPSLRRYARALLRDQDAADDLVQETLRRGWEKLSLFRRESEMRVWLFGIMHNTYIDQRRRPEPSMSLFEEENLAFQEQPAELARLEMLDLESALRELPEDQREILLLVALEGLTYSEVAKAVQLPLGTVMSRLSRAREKLRILMNGGARSSKVEVLP